MSGGFFKKMLGIHGKSKERYDALANFEPVPGTSTAKKAHFHQKDGPDVVCDVYDYGSKPPEDAAEEKPQTTMKYIVTRVRRCFGSYSRLSTKPN